MSSDLLDPVTGLPFRRPLGAVEQTERVSTGVVRPLVATVVTIICGYALYRQESVRDMEALQTDNILNLLGVTSAEHIGSAVLFSTADGRSGLVVTLGCTALFLLVPFMVFTVALLAVRRISPLAGLGGLLASAAVLFATNQVRMVGIGLGMAYWGPTVGYGRTHLLLGALISSIGYCIATAAYLHLVVRLSGDHTVSAPPVAAGRAPAAGAPSAGTAGAAPAGGVPDGD